MPTVATNTWSETGRLDPVYNVEDAEQENVTIAASLTLAKGTVMGELLGTNGLVTITPGGTISGGTFTITVGANTTAAIAWNATMAAIQAALELLASVGVGNVAVAGGPVATTPFTLAFQNALGYQVAPTVSASAASLTGTAPTLTPAVTAAGTAGTKGTFAAYKYSNTDGTQFAKGLLAYALTTDGSGNVTLTGEWGATVKAAPVYMRGYFKTQDCVGLDQNAITQLGGTILEGTVASGIWRF